MKNPNPEKKRQVSFEEAIDLAIDEGRKSALGLQARFEVVYAELERAINLVIPWAESSSTEKSAVGAAASFTRLLSQCSDEISNLLYLRNGR